VKSQDSSRIDCQKFSTRLDGWWNLDRVMPGTVVPPASERTSDTAGVLQESMLEAVAGWHPAVQVLVRGLDPDSTFAIPFGFTEQLDLHGRGEVELADAIGTYEAQMRAAAYPILRMTLDHDRTSAVAARKGDQRRGDHLIDR
jgi:hypothetical protein